MKTVKFINKSVFPEHMINFTGDWNNLEGKVIVYSKLIGVENNVKVEKAIPSLYLTTDILDFVEKVRGKELLQWPAGEITRILGEAIKDIGKQNKIFPVFGFIKELDSEKEITQLAKETLYVGNYSHKDACMEAIKCGAQLYGCALMDQMQTKLDIGSAKIHKKTLTYEKFIKGDKKDDITDYVLKNYVVPMIDAHDEKNPIIYRTLKQELVNFAAGSAFAQYVIKLCNVIEDGKKKPNNDLIWSYVLEMNAIHTERYEEAAKIRDEIDKAMKT